MAMLPALGRLRGSTQRGSASVGRAFAAQPMPAASDLQEQVHICADCINPFGPDATIPNGIADGHKQQTKRVFGLMECKMACMVPLFHLLCLLGYADMVH